ncbi:MAG: hypothetical protein AAGC72_00460 [Planctomycetota bacterium]
MKTYTVALDCTVRYTKRIIAWNERHAIEKAKAMRPGKWATGGERLEDVIHVLENH